jgi:class 3 adenylate cyclase
VTQESVARGFLFADLRGYSGWAEAHGDQAAAELLVAYRSIVRSAVADHTGAEIRTEGDSFYIAFGSPSAAIRCGLRILELAAASRGPDGQPMAVGVGVHAGETVRLDEGYVGTAVNIAARVCARAAAGELLVTDAVRALTRTYLPVHFTSRGRQRLKGISEPITLYRVDPAGPESVPARPERRTIPIGRAWRLAGGVATVALLLVGTALIGGALVREGAGTSDRESRSPIASVSAATASASQDIEQPYPDETESELLALLDAAHHDDCRRALVEERPVYRFGPGNVIRVTVFGGIACSLGGISAPDSVLLWSMVAGGGQGGFTYQVTPNEVLHNRSSIVEAVRRTCADDVPALEEWSFGSANGLLLCYETSTGDARVMWSADESGVLGEAVRSDRDMPALLDWWAQKARFAAAGQ